MTDFSSCLYLNIFISLNFSNHPPQIIGNIFSLPGFMDGECLPSKLFTALDKIGMIPLV